jgi:uncharacterized protein (TIGR00725 family)
MFICVYSIHKKIYEMKLIMDFKKQYTKIGIMGPGSTANKNEMKNAERLGSLIAHYTKTVGENIFLYTGGGGFGVMNAALRGAKKIDKKFPTIAIFSGGKKEDASEYAELVVPTGMGEGRNYLNIKSGDIIVFCCENPWKSLGTNSEFTFTMKHKLQMIIVCRSTNASQYRKYFKDFSRRGHKFPEPVIVHTPGDAMEEIIDIINSN